MGIWKERTMSAPIKVSSCSSWPFPRPGIPLFIRIPMPTGKGERPVSLDLLVTDLCTFSAFEFSVNLSLRWILTKCKNQIWLSLVFYFVLFPNRSDIVLGCTLFAVVKVPLSLLISLLTFIWSWYHQTEVLFWLLKRDPHFSFQTGTHQAHSRYIGGWNGFPRLSLLQLSRAMK